MKSTETTTTEQQEQEIAERVAEKKREALVTCAPEIKAEVLTEVAKEVTAEIKEEGDGNGPRELLPGEQRLKEWLLSRSLEAKIAHTILAIGCNADCDMETFANAITDQYEDEVSEALANSSEDSFIHGVASRLISWQTDFCRG